MRHFLSEILSTWAAFLILGALLVGAGALFARLFRFPGFVEARLGERMGLSLLVAFASLPVLLDLVGRLGPAPMAAFALACALAGLPALMRDVPPRGQLHSGLVAATLIWLIAAPLALADWPDANGFVRSVLSVDHVKHAAATWSIAESGTPPWNPSFFEPGRTAAYYYFFYTLTGAASFIGGYFGLAARHFAYAACLLAPFALYALLETLVDRTRATEALDAPASRRPLWTVALIATTGLDILPVLLLQNAIGYYPPDPEWWNEQVASWVETFLWTPHHLAGLAAAYVGFIALTAEKARDWRGPALAALAFASMSGQSVYVAIGATASAFVWLVYLASRRRWRDVARLGAAGLGALALALPWLLTLAGQVGGGAPLALSLRVAPWHWEVCGESAACVALGAASIPFFYLIEFGIFALGAYAFWRTAGRRGLATDMARLMLTAALVALLIGTFVRSTVLFNDLGWRIVLFAQVAAGVWTLAVARAGAFDAGPLRTPALVCLSLGYAMAATEFYQFRQEPKQSALERATLAEEIPAWAWLNARLPIGGVVQERPRPGRAYSYGLLGHFPSYVSDRLNARLFGASQEAIARRMAELAPVFETPGATLAQVRAIAASHAISAFVVTANDPIFAARDSWLFEAKPDYQSPRVRIYLFNTPAK